MNGPRGNETLTTARLALRRPRPADAEAIFARYATEALRAMVGAARPLGVRRLFAVCHHEHGASARVLEKSGFSLEGVLRGYAVFPNLAPGEPQDVLCYAILL